MSDCIILTGGTWNKDEWSKIQRSVGPYRIATALEQQGYSTFVFDYIINFSFEEIKQVLWPIQSIRNMLFTKFSIKDTVSKSFFITPS